MSSVRHRLRWPEATEAWRVYVVALALAAVIEATVRTSDANNTATAIVGNLCATLPLAAARRLLPVVALAVTAATFVLLADVATLTAAAVVAQATVVYLLGLEARRVLALAATLPFLLDAIVPIGGEDNRGRAVLVLVVVAAAWTVGDSRRQRGEAVAERDASRVAMETTLRERGALQERARIARELHDVVAHHLSMIAVQAETARLTTPAMPTDGQDRLNDIATTARDALDEMRRLLALLRTEQRTDGEGREPQPGLAQLDSLVESARAAGTPVRLTLRGSSGQVPASVDLSAYRIIQEALTNARRHAVGAAVTVDVCYATDMLHVRVEDDGPGPADDGHGGQGITGMQERAAMVGGTLRTGRGGTGGFVVEAELPLVHRDGPAPAGPE
jgi:signal transduction histidine kinase